VVGDLDDAASMDAAFREAAGSRLVNLASLGFGHAPAIVAAAEDAGMRRAIFVSTTAVFAKLNAASKDVRLAAEQCIQASALDWTIIRPTMIYGSPDDRNMWRLLRFLRRSPVVPLPGGGRHLQQPIHVADLASVIANALDADVAIVRSYDVAGPEPLLFQRVVEEAARAAGRSTRTVSVPTGPLVRALALFERAHATLPLKSEQVARLTEDKTFDISEAVADLGFAPRAFAEGINAEAAALR
jgi:nucleoside-diphosphate-sugar epimerase